MEQDRRILNYTLAITLLSTVLTAAAPLVATFVDGLFVGNMLGGEAFNAINVILPISNFIAVLTLICSMGGSVLAAKAVAARDEMKARKIFTISGISAFGVAALCTVLMYFFMDSFASFVCSDEASLPYFKDYLGVLLIYFLFLPLNSVLNNFISQEGFPGFTTKVVIAANVLNILMDVLFMCVFHMGVKGAALATVISGAINAAAYIPFFMKGKSRYRLVHLHSGDIPILKATIVQGVAFNVFYIMVNALVFFVNRLILGLLGSDGMQIFGVCIQLQSLTFCIAVGEACGGIAQVTRLQGAAMNKSIAYVIRRLIQITVVCYGILLIVMTAFPAAVASMFGISSPEVLGMCRIPFFCFSAYYLCFAILAVYTTISFQLMGHVSAKFFFIFGLGFVVYFLMFLLSGISPELIWWGFPLGGLIMLCAAVAYGYSKHREYPGFTLFTLVDRMPDEVVMERTLSYDCKELPEIMKDLKLFTSICELPESVYDGIELCCNEYCDYLREFPVPFIARSFNIFFREIADGISMVIESAGSPHTIIMDEETRKRVLENKGDLSQPEIRQLMLATIPHDIEYRYMFGLNVTTMTWKK